MRRRPRPPRLPRSQGTALLPRYPHRAARTFSTVAHRFAVGALIVLITCALLAALYDIGQQLVKSTRASKISDLIITFGTYVVITMVGIVIWISRAFQLRASLASIPKPYLPTGQDDVPKPAFELISNEFDRASVIAHISQPKGRTQDGWGRPGTAHENVHFRQAILSTISVLQSILNRLYPPPPLSPRASPLSPVAPLLALSPSPVPDALVPLAEMYEEYLIKAKFGQEEPTEEDWDACVKLVAVFIGVVGPGSGAAGTGKTEAGVIQEG
ncbi:hypothetical protein RQP46_003968 [Phenoliferia psychrophenolica]